MAKVSLTNVFKIYSGDKGKSVKAVRDFNLEVADQEFVVFVGPSGCGKSTTLRMIAGLEEISAGTISIDDRKVNDVPPKDRDIAMVFQNYALYPHMSVYENMAFGLKLRKYAKPEIDCRVRAAAEILGIVEYLDRKPKALSGGQRQRVAVGRAIVRQPKVFLFDEPLSNLDAKMRVQMRTEIIKLHRQLKATMIYVTHDQIEAMTMGDRIVVMAAVEDPQTGDKEGVIQQIDKPLKVYQQPVNLFVAGFMGSPPMNFIRGVIRLENTHLIFVENGSGLIRLPCDRWLQAKDFIDQEIILGVRPEDVETVNPEEKRYQDTFVALTEMIEPMGAETNLYCQTGTHSVVCRTPQQIDSTRAGQSMEFHIKAANAHLFDPVTTNRIS